MSFCTSSNGSRRASGWSKRANWPMTSSVTKETTARIYTEASHSASAVTACHKEGHSLHCPSARRHPAIVTSRASRADRAALRILQFGAVAVVVAAAPFKAFDLDRFFVPKELVLHVVALAAALLCL